MWSEPFVRASTSIASAVLAGVLAVGTALASAPAVAAGSAPIPLPSSPRGLEAPVAQPSTVDPPSPYLPQAGCWPVDKTGAKKLRDLVLATYGRGGRGNISRGCTEGVSEHSEGRAWDWMINPASKSEKAAAADFLSWVTKDSGRNARRLGIMYVIYNKKIWSVYRAKDGWRSNSGHLDHVHISLSWNGARATTSFWTGKVSPIDRGPCPRFVDNLPILTAVARTGSCPALVNELFATSRPDRVYGTTGSSVSAGQGLLKIARTGRFDVATLRAVRAFQKKNDIVYTGALDGPTWRALDPANVTRSPAVASLTQIGCHRLRGGEAAVSPDLPTGGVDSGPGSSSGSRHAVGAEKRLFRASDERSRPGHAEGPWSCSGRHRGQRGMERDAG